MLDANLLRNDLDAVAARLSERGYTLDRARYQELDQRRRVVLQEAEALKAERNRVSEEVGRLKRAKENADHLIAQQREVGDQLKTLEAAEREIEAAFKDFLADIPNPPHASVPSGRDEHANVEIKRWGRIPEIAAPRDHVDLGTALGILDLDRAAKLSGARFAVLKGLGAKLERSLISFMLDRQTGAGYTEVIPPYLVNAESMYGTGQLPKFEQDLFKTSRGDGAALYLIPTAEVPVTNLYRDEILPAEALPLRHCAFTPCFRSEAGSYGKDTKGIIRQHQFHKVELVTFAAADQAEAELERPHGKRRGHPGGPGPGLPPGAALHGRHGFQQPEDLRPGGVAALAEHLPGDQLLQLVRGFPGPPRQHPHAAARRASPPS